MIFTMYIHKSCVDYGICFFVICLIQIINHDDHGTIRYCLDVPSNAPVGAYDVFIVIPTRRRKPAIRKQIKEKIVILFNPWCESRS